MTSFGFSPSDIGNAVAFAWLVYKAYRRSIGEFETISGELLSLHAILLQAEETFKKTPLSTQQGKRLEVLTNGSQKLLQDLEAFLKEYESLATTSKRTWDRVRWRSEEVHELRTRITNQVGYLTAFYTLIVSNSLLETKEKLRNLAREYRDGSREGSFTGPQTPATTDRDSDIEWTQLAKDLEDVGIPREVVAKNRRFFAAWLAEAILKQTPEKEQTTLLDRLWTDPDTATCEEDNHRCNFCNSDDHDTYQHKMFGSWSPTLALISSTAIDTTDRSDDTSRSFFDGLGTTGFSLAVGFGGADQLRETRSPSSDNASVTHTNALTDAQRRPSSLQRSKTSETRTKSRRSLAKFSTLGSSSPGFTQVHSPFGGGFKDT
ncbi:MAG: hypothetical protein M1830_010239 [Pleopsidium flavum]|nr:MAG: hypothetical protein M1830_010239 [Pleopsidium flavum]